MQPNMFPQYPPQQFSGYPPQGYQAQPPAAPAQPLAQGTLDDFYSQPASGGSKALAFPVIGTRYVGIIERPITNGDIQQQTSPPAQGSVPQRFKDGRPKLTMRVPLQMQPSPEFPDGRATWFVKSADRDELARAMAEAGAPEGAPEHGAIIDVAYVSDAASGQGMNPRKVKRVAYTRPNGAGPVTPRAPMTEAVPVPAIPGPGADALAVQQAAYLQAQQAVPPVAPPAPATAPVTPEPSEAQKILLANLTGQTG